jgi:hypothetical protein
VTAVHPSQPVRELALNLAAMHRLPADTAESIVERAEKYTAFLKGGDTE